MIPIHLPSLRKRKDDIPLLVNTFINRLEILTGKPIRELTRDALNRFMNYRWPGNVREMKSALEYAFTVADRDTIDIDHLPPQLLVHPLHTPPVVESVVFSTGSNERQQLIDALHAAGGNQSQAAPMVGINRVTVWNRMRKYGINLKREIKR